MNRSLAVTRSRTAALPPSQHADRVASPDPRPFLGGAIGVWAPLATTTCAILLTYTRLPAAYFPPGSPQGLARGACRALRFLNFPVAPIALALAVLAVAGPAVTLPGRRRVGPVSAAAILALIAARTGYLSLMLVYGVANVAQDFWLGQIVRLGWTDLAIPDVLWPAVTSAWGFLPLATAIIWTCILHQKGG